MVYPVLPPGEAFEYEPHARDRMARRGITEDHVRVTLEEPNDIRIAVHRPPTEPCNIYLRRIGARTCKVYVRVLHEPMRVATVAWHGE